MRVRAMQAGQTRSCGARAHTHKHPRTKMPAVGSHATCAAALPSGSPPAPSSLSTQFRTVENCQPSNPTNFGLVFRSPRTQIPVLHGGRLAGGALRACAAGAGGHTRTWWSAAGPLIFRSARIRRVRLCRGRHRGKMTAMKPSPNPFKTLALEGQKCPTTTPRTMAMIT